MNIHVKSDKLTKLHIPIEIVMDKVFKQDSTNTSRVAKAKYMFKDVLSLLGYDVEIQGSITEAIHRNKEFIRNNGEIYRDIDCEDPEGVMMFHYASFNGINSHLSDGQKIKAYDLIKRINIEGNTVKVKDPSGRYESPPSIRIPLGLLIEKLGEEHEVIDTGMIKYAVQMIKIHGEYLRMNLYTVLDKKEIDNLEEFNSRIKVNLEDKLKITYEKRDFENFNDNSFEIAALGRYNNDIESRHLDVALTILDTLDYSFLRPNNNSINP